MTSSPGLCRILPSQFAPRPPGESARQGELGWLSTLGLQSTGGPTFVVCLPAVLGKTGAAAAPRGELRHHCEVHTRGHRVGDLDIVFSSSTLAFTRLPLGAGDEHEGSKDTPRVEFSRWGVCSPLLRG